MLQLITEYFIPTVVPLAYLLGFGFAIDAIVKTRTSQGATAWALGLVLMPFLSLPMYWVFGRARFSNYINALRSFDAQVEKMLRGARAPAETVAIDPKEGHDRRAQGELRAFEQLATLNFTPGNSVSLLIDGDETFRSIFEAIDEAENYVLVQFYIVRDDIVGGQFRDRLIHAARRGVRVYLLYDEVGSYKLGRKYVGSLRDAGVHVAGFSGNRRWLSRFRLNFRNHRKIVIVDGKSAFMGGLNVGDEYLGRDKKLTPWRDTHLAISGPAVSGLQYSFARDWYYGHQVTLDLNWTAPGGQASVKKGDDQQALVLASGPADNLETCGLLFTHAIESAEERVWIASPYFVPDGRVLGALQLAALRGVDVRIIVPKMTDNVLFKYVPYAYLPEVEKAGAKVYLYEEGFMHQKVFVVDHDYAAVSTANFDYRSFLYNFEITCLIRGRTFSEDVATMLENDLLSCVQLSRQSLEEHTFFFRVATSITRLIAPIL
ncbi:MAG: cardiolipin synthase [Rhodothermales bacterium]|nr:cardiolipin synthase [Rhodothermales bacterium]